MDKDTKFRCEKCEKIVNYTEIEPNLDLGRHTKENPITATFPHVHKNCGGVVRSTTLEEIKN